jgi:predicted O-methyltransferase YrrM
VPYWTEWPKWEGDTRFRTPNFGFVSSWAEHEYPTDLIPIHKPREFIEQYRSLLSSSPARHIVEIGYLHGGMPVFLADMLPDAKIVAIDRRKPSEMVANIVGQNGLSDRVRFYSGVNQADKAAIRSIIQREFGDAPVDLIMDDASHLYEESKAGFEACFGLLRSGGLYVLEDWGWAPKFAGKVPLTKLLLELVMMLATNSELVSCINIPHGAFSVITRGHSPIRDFQISYTLAGSLLFEPCE